MLWLMGRWRGDELEVRGGINQGCDSDLAPEVGGRLELDPGCSSLGETEAVCGEGEKGLRQSRGNV